MGLRSTTVPFGVDICCLKPQHYSARFGAARSSAYMLGAFLSFGNFWFPALRQLTRTMTFLMPPQRPADLSRSITLERSAGICSRVLSDSGTGLIGPARSQRFVTRCDIQATNRDYSGDLGTQVAIASDRVGTDSTTWRGTAIGQL